MAALRTLGSEYDHSVTLGKDVVNLRLGGGLNPRYYLIRLVAAQPGSIAGQIAPGDLARYNQFAF